ncbi:MAG: PIN domain-containing protein [Haloferacaceae archaeon]
MTVYVETDFLLALAKDSDWLQGPAEDALSEYEVETSAFSYLELVLARERYEFDYVPLVANLLELVPVRGEEEKQVVLKAVNYYNEGMTPFDAFHAATAETRRLDVLSSEKDYENIEVSRVPLEPTDEREG